MNLAKSHALPASTGWTKTVPLLSAAPKSVCASLLVYEPTKLIVLHPAPNAVACFACAKVGRKCRPVSILSRRRFFVHVLSFLEVPEAALPHARILQEAASRLITGEPVSHPRYGSEN